MNEEEIIKNWLNKDLIIENENLKKNIISLKKDIDYLKFYLDREKKLRLKNNLNLQNEIEKIVYTKNKKIARLKQHIKSLNKFIKKIIKESEERHDNIQI